MTVTFPNAPHVGTVWIPQIAPTAGTVASTLVGLTFAALLFSAIIVMLMVVCFEKPFSWLRSVLTFVVVAALCAGIGLVTGQISGAHDTYAAAPHATKELALRAAAESAVPRSAYTLGARETASDGKTVQNGWTPEDRIVISAAAAKQEGLKAPSSKTKATIDAKGTMTDAAIAAHGTSYEKDGKKVRCAVQVADVVKNNIGQPLSAKISRVRCMPEATASATTTS